MEKSCLAFVLPVFFAVCAWGADASAPLPQRQPAHGGVYVVAHRGAHEGIPENTLAAYAKAIELGCDFVEVDLRTTRDGHIVSVHNAEVDDYTRDARGPVSDFTLAELKAMDIGSRIGPEWSNERIPELEEILSLCAGKIGLYVDLKNAPVERVAARLKAHGMQRDAVWYASVSNLRKLAEACPECVPMPDPGTEKGLERVLKAVKTGVIASSYGNLSREFVEAADRAGVVMIVDDDGPEGWGPMVEWGVRGIQTDQPAKLIGWLDNRK